MNDLINRQQAIETFKDDDLPYDIYHGYLAQHFVRAVLEELPSAKPRWIPCTERLPERGQTVIAYNKYRKEIYINTLSSDGITWTKYTHDVTAWLPLPEPYTEEKKR